MKPATIHYEPTTPAGKPREHPYIVTRRGRVIARCKTRIEAQRVVARVRPVPSSSRTGASASRHRPFGSKPTKVRRP